MINMYRLAIVGYGKMGQLIETLANQHGFEVCSIIDPSLKNSITKQNLNNADVAVEFSTPQAALSNYMQLFQCGVNVVTGTTGWHHQLNQVVEECQKQKCGLFYASNFSIGMNITFLLNKQLARMTRNLTNYQVEISETHHTNKIDAPSGTAVTLANGIIENSERYKYWSLDPMQKPESTIAIDAKREGDVIGLHTVIYNSDVDRIQLQHEAYNRQGFALGALEACKYMIKKKGVYTMENLLSF